MQWEPVCPIHDSPTIVAHVNVTLPCPSKPRTGPKRTHNGCPHAAEVLLRERTHHPLSGRVPLVLLDRHHPAAAPIARRVRASPFRSEVVAMPSLEDQIYAARNRQRLARLSGDMPAVIEATKTLDRLLDQLPKGTQ